MQESQGITSLLERASQDKLCIIDGDKSLTYGELNEQSSRFARQIASYEIRGRRVLLFLPNCWQFLVSMHATLKCGATCVPIDFRATQRELEFFLENSKSDLIVTSSSKSDFTKDIPINNIVIDTEPSSSLPIQNAGESKENYKSPTFDPAFLLYTGGTTGSPKGVMLSHNNVLFVLSSLAQAWGMREGREIFAQILPMTHSGGLNCGVNSAMFNGGTTVILRKFDPQALIELVEKYRITAFAGVPTIFNSLVKFQDLEKRDLSSLRICFSSGAALSPETSRAFKDKTGITINVGWGLTEASPQLCVAPLGIFKEHYVGVPLSQTQVVSMDEKNQVLPKGELGELAARGPQVMMGYWQNEEETKKSITSDGWLLTGDLGFVSEDGVYIIGRKKETINSGGYKIWPSEVEHVLMENQHVSEAAVIGVKDEHFGEIVKAFVVLKSDENEAALAKFCKERLSSYKVPKRFEFRNSLPKSSVGKLLRRSLEKEEEEKQQAEQSK